MFILAMFISESMTGLVHLLTVEKGSIRVITVTKLNFDDLTMRVWFLLKPVRTITIDQQHRR